MATRVVDFDDLELKFVANGLEEVADKHFPTAVRNTLNNVAFDMKGTSKSRGTIQSRAESMFENSRTKTFFKKITGVNKAKGTNIEKMVSEAGVFQNSGVGEAADNVAKHETRESVDQKATPLNKARIKSSQKRKIKKSRKHNNMNNVMNLSKLKRGKKMAGLKIAASTGSPVIVKSRKTGKRFYAVPNKRMQNIRRNGERIRGRDGKLIRTKWVKLNFIYRINESEKVDLKKKTPFVTRASEDSLKKLPMIFSKETDKAIKKAFKR